MNELEEIPSISIRQPWAELILQGKKKIEIREWDTDYRGRLWLHTGKKPDGYKLLDYNMRNVFRGGYIGIITLKAVFPFTYETWAKWRNMHLSSGNFKEGLFAWIIETPNRLSSPLVAPGQLGLFKPKPELTQELLKRINKAT